MTERIQFRLNNENTAYLTELKSRYHSDLSNGEILNRVLSEHSEINDNKKLLSKLTYLDKNIESILLIVNSYIIMNGLDDSLPIAGMDNLSKPIQDALEKVNNEIHERVIKKSQEGNNL